MDYQRIYDQIIDRGRGRILQGYRERHHIVPRCMGGSDDEDNLVYLSAREHFLTHWLLARLYPENAKLLYAFWAMCNQKNIKQIKRHTPSSRAYEEGKQAFSQLRKGVPRPDLTGVHHPNFGKSGYWAGKVNPDQAERMKGVGNPNFGKTPLNSFLPGDLNIKYWKGRVGPNKGLFGELNWNSKRVDQYTKQGDFVASFTSIAEAERNTGVRNANIVQCCKGRYKSAGGYVWRYGS